jgi:organic radical activating enzyme
MAWCRRRACRFALLHHYTSEQVAELVLDLVRLRPGSKLTVVSGGEPADDALIYV